MGEREPDCADSVIAGNDCPTRKKADMAKTNRTALVADDDAEMRLVVRTALEQDGWSVEEAGDGKQACSIAEQLQPDIVLLDVAMPELNGLETCGKLRTLPGGAHIPVLMITGMDDQESIVRAYEAGATDFLSKPVNFMILRQRVQYMYRARQASRALQSERDFVSAVVDTAAALVLILDPEGRILRFNSSCELASGLSLDDVRDKTVWDVLVCPEEREQERRMFDRLISERATKHYEGSWTAADGSRREIAWSNAVLVDDDDAVEHVVCTGLDITERNEAEEKIRFLASYDPLTGLPNRSLMAERVDRAIVAADEDGQQLAVLFLDLDRFKYVNATLGHAVGDQLLKGVAERLAKSLRLSDVLARHSQGLRTELGRLAGDDFTVLLTGVSHAKEVAGIIERLQGALHRPFKLEDQEYMVTASVGATLYPADRTDAEGLLRSAESAMCASRDERRGGYHFYSAAMHTSVSRRFSLESELRQAIERGELVLHYQPKVSVETRTIVGAEALVRWQHPSRGLLPPATFIEVAEETGLIVPLGEWVLREACNQVMSWTEKGLRPVPVAVNLSSAQFHLDDLLARIILILNETAMNTDFLAIEVTESVIMRDARQASELLSRLNELGVQVAIDDFGTGYSSLSSLKDLPVHNLKIDRAFIEDLAESPKDVAVTRAIIAIGHGLGLTVVAEGVESEEQFAILREEKCDEIQGFLISPPVPGDQFTSWLSDRHVNETEMTDSADIGSARTEDEVADSDADESSAGREVPVSADQTQPRKALREA